MRPRPSRRPRTAGVSLVEALVALAVMSLGMLALVGVQSSMRFNNDLSKQRGEATRIAQDELERLRTFATLDADPAQPGRSWDEIVDPGEVAYAPQNGIANATYRVSRRVTAQPTNATAAGQRKLIQVVVRWTDRTGVAQSVTVDGVIGGAAPALGALVMARVPLSAATGLVNGRHFSIPTDAVDLGTGRSRLEPPGAAGVAWYFDNTTGLLRVCDSAGSHCQIALLVSGRINFPSGPAENLATPPASLTLSAPFSGDPASTTTCYGVNSAPTSGSIPYVCAIQPALAAGWGGKLDVALAQPAERKVCRYTAATGDYTDNPQHPRTYCMETAPTATPPTACTGRRVSTNLIHQNFLVVNASQSCPSGTLTHQTPPA